MDEILTIQVLSRHLGRYLGRHFEIFNLNFFGIYLYTYGLNLSQIGS